MRALLGMLAIPMVLLGVAGYASAGGLDRVGTSGAQELRIPVGAASIPPRSPRWTRRKPWSPTAPGSGTPR